jgi:anti-sigma regulatory factor (Ser/Thr protein kinase)
VQVLRVQLEIGADPREVGRARRWARSRLAGCGAAVDEAVAETVVLLISELVTNAVVHTGCPAVLHLLLPAGPAPAGTGGPPGAVRVEVADASTRAPRQRQAEGDDTGGRGLELVSGLADRWGWQREDGGKRIWCELDCAGGRCATAAQAPGAGSAGEVWARTIGA